MSTVDLYSWKNSLILKVLVYHYDPTPSLIYLNLALCTHTYTYVPTPSLMYLHPALCTFACTHVPTPAPMHPHLHLAGYRHASQCFRFQAEAFGSSGGECVQSGTCKPTFIPLHAPALPAVVTVAVVMLIHVWVFYFVLLVYKPAPEQGNPVEEERVPQVGTKDQE